VELSLEDRGEEVVFICSDEGLGISQQDREHLFAEFFRSTDPEALRRPGTGLGLAIVSRIVARHAGQVEVDSELGKGTTFRIVFPRARR
jgi:signal transduction histidine kinase